MPCVLILPVYLEPWLHNLSQFRMNSISCTFKKFPVSRVRALTDICSFFFFKACNIISLNVFAIKAAIHVKCCHYYFAILLMCLYVNMYQPHQVNILYMKIYLANKNNSDSDSDNAAGIQHCVVNSQCFFTTQTLNGQQQYLQ